MVFMYGFDRYISRSVHANLLISKRFVDDLLVVVHRVTRSALLELFNSWCLGIIITNDEFEGSVNTTFLDLSISRLGSLFVYSTYRKPLDSYAYLPFSSNHSLAVKSGIVATECCRL